MRDQPNARDLPARQAASANRQRLTAAGVVAVNIMGGPGCGKTSLLEVTLRRLVPERRIGVITADAQSRCDADRLAGQGNQLIHLDPGPAPALTAAHVGEALGPLDLAPLDLLLIENISSMIGPGGVDIGQTVSVAMFSVAAGHEKPVKFQDVVRGAALVVLNKTDLLSIVPFDRDAFRAIVAQLNPHADVLEMSTLTGDGVEAWLEWLRHRSPVPKRDGRLPPGAAR